MEGEVALEAGMCDGKMSAAVCIGWMYGFHATVESKDEVVEIETKAETVGDCNLPPELIELKLSARLVFVVAYGPDVASINEGRAVQFPEKVGTVFHIHIELDVACLVDEIDTSIRTLETARTEFANAPAADAVCSTAEIPLLVRQDVGVAVWESNAQGCM